MKSVLVLGGVTYDRIVYLEDLPQPVPGNVFAKGTQATVGGTGAGKALNLNRLGVPVKLHALIGDDPHGKKVRALFEAESCPLITDIDPAGTEHHINLIAEDGRRVSIYVQTPTLEPTVDTDEIEKYIKHFDMVALNIINYTRAFIPAIKAAGKPIWCDIHDYDGQSDYHQEYIDAADVLFMSSDAMPDYRPFMEAMIAQGKQLVVVTHGRDGSSALTADGQWFDVPITPLDRKDPNGAGDAYFAGVLYGYLQQQPIEKCLHMGTLVAGLTVGSDELFHPDLSASTLAVMCQHFFDE